MSSGDEKSLAETLTAFPDSPGVYLMKNRRGRVLYVGKAKDLSVRVRSYLQKPEALDAKTNALMRAATQADYIATDTEVEALVLECTLIKEHRPRYNIRLKDDKRYPYLKLTVSEPFPRLLLVRRIEDDAAEYFGPFTDSAALRRMLRTLKTLVPLRDCAGEQPGRFSGRECLNYHIGRCLAPCTGKIDMAEYRELVHEVRLFLKGRTQRLHESLEKRMWQLAREKRYEEAAAARDQIAAVDRLSERQHAVSPRRRDEDFVSMAREGALACGVVVKVREGSILGRESFLMPVTAFDADGDIFASFFELYYHSTTDIPPHVYVQFRLARADLMRRWLRNKTGRNVAIALPQRGHRRALLDLAMKNAVLQLATETRTKGASAPALRELKAVLALGATPARIEAYDISNIQGADAVGSMVTFVDGMPLKSMYRHFRIRSVTGSDDYGMMREMLARRVARLADRTERRPSLIVVDGGKGQVGAARAAMDELSITGIPVIGLSKKNEEIWTEGRPDAIRLPRRSAALRLLQRMRNEAHRFAVAYHRKLRGKGVRRSELERIPGIGEKRRTALLVEFGSLNALSRATPSEIAAVPGIGEKNAKKIYEYLHKE
jgi:excinuclease ABC subunit C